MRIALDVSKAAGHDGLGTYSRELTRALGRLEGERRLLLLNLLGDVGEDELRRTFEESDFDSSGLELDLEPWRDKTAAEQRGTLAGADAFVASSWTLPAAAPPSLFVVYDLTIFSHPHCHTLANRLHCAEGLLRARRLGSRFAAISRATAGELRERLGVEAADVSVLTPGVGEIFKPLGEAKKDEVRRRILEAQGLASARGYVLSVGSLEPRKNLPRLLGAHGRLGDELRRAFPLLLVGGAGWHNRELARLLAESPEDSVRHLGAVDEPDLVELFGATSLFVYPSLAEGFGLPVAEAMACGAPVVTSNVSSLPEVAGDAARFVDPVDTAALAGAMDELLRGEDAARELARRGPGRAALFSWRDTARRLVGLLDEMA